MNGKMMTWIAAICVNFLLFAAEAVVPSFEWTCTGEPTGWITGWNGESGGGEAKVVTGNGIETLKRTSGWSPYCGFSAPTSFTLAVYGTADLVEPPAAGKYAILWGLGAKSGVCNALLKDSEGNVLFAQLQAGVVKRSISAGKVGGYHLFTVTFDVTDGSVLYVDGQAVGSDARMNTASAAGFQVGSLYGGATGDIVKMSGFVPISFIGYDSAISAAEVAELAATHPAVTTIDQDIVFSQSGGKLYLPSLTNSSGNLFQVKAGTLVVPGGVSASLERIEFGDNGDSHSCGLTLDGTLSLTWKSTSTCTVGAIYNSKNTNDGILFGEWTGSGNYVISGLLFAPDAYAELLHDAGEQNFTIDGGRVVFKGVTAKKTGVIVTLVNGGSYDFGVTGSAAEDGVYTLTLPAANQVVFTTQTEYRFTEPQTVSSVLSGGLPVVVDVGDGKELIFSAANTFTKGLYVESGTAKTTNATGYGPNNYLQWENPGKLSQIYVAKGARLDVGGTANSSYAITTSGEVTNSGADIEATKRQTVKLLLNGDATVSGNTFGLLAHSYNATQLELGGHVLTVAMNEGKDFILYNTTIKSVGTIKLVSGRLFLAKTLSGAFELDLSDYEGDGAIVYANDAEAVASLGAITLSDESARKWELVVDGSAITAVKKEEELPEDDETDLHISEICPEDAQLIDGLYETGWVELVNKNKTGSVNLKDYELVRANRGSKASPGAASANLPDCEVPAGGRVVVYCNETMEVGADGRDKDGRITFAKKINPKKYPLVQLYRGTTEKTLVDSVIVPVDCPDGASIFVERVAGKVEEETEEKSTADSFTQIMWSDDEMVIDAPGEVKEDGTWDLSTNIDKLKGVTLAATVAERMLVSDTYTVDLKVRVTKNTGTSLGNTTVGMPIFESRPSSLSPYNGVILYIAASGDLILQPRTATKGASTIEIDSDVDFNDGEWHRVVFVGSQLEDGRVMVLIDGSLVLDRQMPCLAPLQSNRPLCFGRAYDSSHWNAFCGEIKDVKLYSGNASSLAREKSETTESGASELLQDYSIGYKELKAGASRRFIAKYPTPGVANNPSGAVAIGPQITTLYGIKNSDHDPWVSFPEAVQNEDYAIRMPVNPVSEEEGDAITSVGFIVRIDQQEPFLVQAQPDGADAKSGQFYRGIIPAAKLPQPGHLVRWAAQITDAAGNVWRSPSGNNPDGAFEWYGTIVTPTEDLLSRTLQTFHLFGESGVIDVPGSGSTGYLMNKQYDSIKGSYPYGARVGVYDSVSKKYYDNVRIDLRGHTTASFKKKSHGLRFNKSQPLTCTDPVTGTIVDGVRKTSFIAEYADPAHVRQSLAFKVLRDVGVNAPFDYPVRLNLNGEFYELAFHSNRFTDELLENYGLDEYGYGYKNAGSFGSGASSGSTTKVLPDDGNSTDSVYFPALTAKLSAAGKATTKDEGGLEDDVLTETVARDFNFADWMNYIAITRITSECDDVWGNLCAYYDINGTGTWSPLAYDMNLSWGQWHHGDDSSTYPGCRADVDLFKSHPFYGGWHVRAHRYNLGTEYGNGNYAYEAIFQHEKYRRLYLRRLRSVMDEILMSPGTSKTDTPFWDYVMTVTEALRDDLAKDLNIWGNGAGCTAVYPWKTWLDLDDGVADLWDNYVVPRRIHLYETHAAAKTSKVIGYGQSLAAGIPERQSAPTAFVGQLTAEYDESKLAVVIRNTSAETIDVSDWELTGPVTMKLPKGSVLDCATNGVAGELFVTADRQATIAAFGQDLFDQIVIGNGTVGATTSPIVLKAGEVTLVEPSGDPLQGEEITGVFVEPVELSAGSYVLANAEFQGGLTLIGATTLSLKSGTVNRANTIVASNGLALSGTGTLELSGSETLMNVSTLTVEDGLIKLDFTGGSDGASAVVFTEAYVQNGGDVRLTLAAEAKVYGFYCNTKTAKGPAVQLNGGSFSARIAGGKSSAAFKLGKGTNNVVLNGTAISVELGGEAPRFVNTDGKLELTENCGDIVVTTDSVGGAGADVFKSAMQQTLAGGYVNVIASGEGSEIFSSDAAIEVLGGVYVLTASDDCFSAATEIAVSGGIVYALSTAGDALDSNGTMKLTGGYVFARTYSNEHQALDVDPSEVDGAEHTLIIDEGATVVAMGGVDAGLHGPDAGSTAICLMADSTTRADKYIVLTGGTKTERTVTTVNWENFVADTTTPFTLIATVPGFDGNRVEGGKSVKPDKAFKLDARVDGVFVVTTERPAETLWTDAEVTDETPLDTLLPAAQATKLAALKVKSSVLAKWAKTYLGGCAMGTEINLEAFALDCAPDAEAIAAAKKSFKAGIRMVDGKPVVESMRALNVQVKVVGAVDLTGPFAENTEGARFFKLVIPL